jgi:hypothetical protein
MFFKGLFSYREFGEARDLNSLNLEPLKEGVITFYMSGAHTSLHPLFPLVHLSLFVIVLKF